MGATMGYHEYAELLESSLFGYSLRMPPEADYFTSFSHYPAYLILNISEEALGLVLSHGVTHPIITFLELAERIRRIEKNPIDGGILEIIEEVECVKVIIGVAVGIEVIGHSGNFGIPSERV
tara:strand:+ start:75 stop:440 length:366 start_codon:yes stop_codon:yes gene_type:complete